MRDVYYDVIIVFMFLSWLVLLRVYVGFFRWVSKLSIAIFGAITLVNMSLILLGAH